MDLGLSSCGEWAGCSGGGWGAVLSFFLRSSLLFFFILKFVEGLLHI
jgi:hypothetical protein